MAQLARTPVQIGDALRRYRLAAGITQSQLAARAGLRQATISQIENGQGATRLDTLCTLLAALDLEMTIGPRTRSSPKDIEDLF